MAYKQPVKKIGFIASVASIITISIASMTFYSAVDYFSQLQQKLKFTNVENIKLLDGMHEGLLILNKPVKHDNPRTVMFCNRPNYKLINTFLGQYNSNSPPAQTNAILRANKFIPMKQDSNTSII